MSMRCSQTLPLRREVPLHMDVVDTPVQDVPVKRPWNCDSCADGIVSTWNGTMAATQSTKWIAFRPAVSSSSTYAFSA